MNVSVEMKNILNELGVIEAGAMSSINTECPNELGNELIKLFHCCDNNDSKALIRSFMSLAGVVWLRKLLTRDTRPIASSKGKFASLNDYLRILSEQEDVAVI